MWSGVYLSSLLSLTFLLFLPYRYIYINDIKSSINEPALSNVLFLNKLLFANIICIYQQMMHSTYNTGHSVLLSF